MKISCVIACYKDEQAIPVIYERIVNTFNKIDVEYEIIFVNDSSPDESLSAIVSLSAKDPNVIGINHRRNFGSQSAFLSGMKVSSGDDSSINLFIEYLIKWHLSKFQLTLVISRSLIVRVLMKY